MKSISHQEGLVASTIVAVDMSTTEEQDPLMLKEVTVLKTSGALGAQGATERSEGSSGTALMQPLHILVSGKPHSFESARVRSGSLCPSSEGCQI